MNVISTGPLFLKKKKSASFVPLFFCFHLSCPFKIRHFNLGVFPAAIDQNRELASCGRERHIKHVASIQAIISLLSVFFFNIIYIYITGSFFSHMKARWSRPSAWSRCNVCAIGEQLRPCDHFMIDRDDMNVTRSRSALPVQQPRPGFLASGGKHLPQAFGWISNNRLGGWRRGSRAAWEPPRWEWHAAVKTGNWE